MLLNSQHFICGSKKEGGLQTSRSIVPTKNDLEISICDSDFWSSYGYDGHDTLAGYDTISNTVSGVTETLIVYVGDEFAKKYVPAV